MKKQITLLVILIGFLGFSQNIKTTGEVETLYLLEAERSVVKPGETVSEKMFQLGEMNNNEIIVISEHNKTMPAIYTKQAAISKKIGVNVYFNKMGLYLIQYNEKSYVSVYPQPLKELGKAEWAKFMFANFYSLDQSMLKDMTKEKIEKFAIEISKKAI